MSIEDLNDKRLAELRKIDQENKERIQRLADEIVKQPLQPKTGDNPPSGAVSDTALPENREGE